MKEQRIGADSGHTGSLSIRPLTTGIMYAGYAGDGSQRTRSHLTISSQGGRIIYLNPRISSLLTGTVTTRKGPNTGDQE